MTENENCQQTIASLRGFVTLEYISKPSGI